MEVNTTAPATATTPTTPPAPVVQFAIVRNEKSMNIVLDAKSRGDNKGKPYLRPEDVTETNLQDYILWLSPKMVADILNAKLALMGSNITEQATSDDGVLSQELAEKYFSDFSTRGETKAELEERKDSVTLEMRKVSVDTTLSKDEKLAKIMALGDEIARLLEAIAAKSRERKPKTESEVTAES